MGKKFWTILVVVALVITVLYVWGALAQLTGR